MKKITLTKQLIIIFTSVMLLSTVLFTWLTNDRLTKIYIDQNYQTLSQFLISSRLSFETNPLNDSLDTGSNLAYISGTREGAEITYVTSQNALNFITEDEALILARLFAQSPVFLASYLPALGELSTDRGTIYYTGYSDGSAFMVALSDESMIRARQFESVRDLLLIFIAIIILGNAMIAIWSRGLVKRIKHIASDVLELPGSDYKKVIVTQGNDEVSELASNIETMRQTIASNEAIKQEMLQNVSHDFKTPIAVIKSYAEAMIDGVEGVESAEVIIRQTNILRHKVHQLLELNKLEYLNDSLEFDTINLEDIVKNVLSNYKHLSKIEFKVIANNPFVKGFTENYYSIIENMVDNAVRYAKNEIVFTLSEDEWSIYNDGESIDPKFIPSIFSPYVKSHKGQYGLGMSIVSKTLKHFGYTITVENIDKGVIFKIKKKTL